jgi:hypothetical protein
MILLDSVSATNMDEGSGRAYRVLREALAHAILLPSLTGTQMLI